MARPALRYGGCHGEIDKSSWAYGCVLRRASLPREKEPGSIDVSVIAGFGGGVCCRGSSTEWQRVTRGKIERGTDLPVTPGGKMLQNDMYSSGAPAEAAREATW